MNMPRRPMRLLVVALSLCSTLAAAAPGGQPGRDDDRQHQQHQSQAKPQSNAHKAKQQAPSNSRHQPSQPNRSGPPADLSPVGKDLHKYRNEIGRGGPVPAHVKVIKGKPLPQGYGKRLPASTLAHLPRYEGYEWRRIGSDMVLVVVTTGIVYAVFSGILN